MTKEKWTCARLKFPDGNAIGKRIQLGGRDDKKEWLEIVGIVGDVRRASKVDPLVALRYE